MDNKETRRVPNVRGFLNLVVTPLLITAIAVICVGSWSCQKQQYSGPVEKLTLGTSLSELSALVWVAESQGYFVQNGLEVTIDLYESGSSAFQSLTDRTNDIACASDYVFAVNSFVENNVWILAQIDRASIQEIVARKDHGIEKSSDLKGKKIGVSKKTVSDFYLSKFLIYSNLKPDDIEVIDLSPLQLVESLSNGTIDAASLFEPYFYTMKQSLGSNGISLVIPIRHIYYWLLIAREDVVKARPAAIERFLQSMVQAEEFTNKNPAKAMQIVAQRLKLGDAYVQYSWPKSNFMVSLDQGLLIALERQAGWLISSKLTDKTQIPNYLNLIHLEALNNINPKAIYSLR